MINGHLRAQGVIVNQLRIRESLQRTDPDGTVARLRTSVPRCVYDVPEPQYLWHIHKLVRYSSIGGRCSQSSMFMGSSFN